MHLEPHTPACARRSVQALLVTCHCCCTWLRDQDLVMGVVYAAAKVEEVSSLEDTWILAAAGP